MRREWDARARENSKYYINTGYRGDDREFALSGHYDLNDQVLCHVHLGGEARALEIGCGIGRLLKPLAERVGRAYGVDISAEMVRQARGFLAGVPNVELFATAGDLPLADGSIDFCFSYIVFQHIPDADSVFRYLHEAGRVLAPGGMLRFQVDQREASPAAAPDTWTGVRLEHAAIVPRLASAGLLLLDAWGRDTHYCWYTATKPGEAPRERRATWAPPEASTAAVRRLLLRAGRVGPDGQADPAATAALLAGRVSWRSTLGCCIDAWADLDDGAFLDRLYHALLDRAPSPVERDNLLRWLSAGERTRATVLDTLVAGRELRESLR